jgi:hypothetical protein
MNRLETEEFIDHESAVTYHKSESAFVSRAIQYFVSCILSKGFIRD